MRESWEIKRIGDVCEVLDSKRKPITKSNRQSGSIPYYGATGIQDYVKDYIFDGRYLLIGEDGAKWGKDDNTAFIIEGKSWVNNHAHILQLHSNVIDSFVRYYLNGKDLNSFITGAVVPKLTQAALVSIPIPVPPLQEQERIVAELDLLTGIIDKQKQQLKELDTLAQSIFYDMFGNPVDNEKGWKTCRLESIIQVKGRVGWKGYKKEDLRDSGALAIGGGHLTNSGEIDLSEPVYLSMEKYEESPEIMIETGDLILVQRGTIGKVGLVRTDIGQATINPCVLILRPKTINNVYALHFFLNSNMQEHLKTLIRGVAQPMITQQQVNSLCVPIPPSEQQEVFAQRVQAIEAQKKSINCSIAESQKLFDYTMDKYFG